MAQNANEALLDAVENGCLRGVKLALKAGADIDHIQEDDDGNGPALLIASINGHANIVRLLLRKGASVSKKTTGTLTPPLQGAASRGHIEVVNLLVHHGATLDTRDTFQSTPLMTACINRQVDTVRRLIELGARVDLTDSFGRTAQTYCKVDLDRDNCDCLRKEMLKLIEEAMRTKLLRCCNPTCGKPGYRSTLKLCGRCKLTRYCSRDCQKQHWLIGHKRSCGQDACPDEGLNPYLKLIKLAEEHI